MKGNNLGCLLLVTFYLQVSCYPSFLSSYTYKLFPQDSKVLLQNSTDLPESIDFDPLYATILEYQYEEPEIDYSDLDDIDSIYAFEAEEDYNLDLEYDLEETPVLDTIIIAPSNSTANESEHLGSDYLNKKLNDHENERELQEYYYNTYSSDNNTNTNTTIIITTSQHFPLDSDLDDFERELKQVLSKSFESDYDDRYEGESYIYVDYDSDEDEYLLKYYNTTQIEIEQKQKEMLEEEDDEDDEEDSVSDSSSAWDV
jgi:hypothetical protein